ncbi:MAG: hypothetical protein HYY57_05835 [Candidatus Omnitrophica bacterium]|nr:hypothetical protein [Candidatus Omnitrophota bacterium]
MKRPLLGSYEEARLFALRRFNRLSATQKVIWLSKMNAFIQEGRASLRSTKPGKKKPLRPRR